jgi:hypothetical protein
MNSTLSLEKNVEQSKRSLLWRSIALSGGAVVFAVLLSGCFPTLGPTRHFRYSIDYSFDGQRYLKVQDISCVPIKNFTERTGGVEPGWHISGQGIRAVELGHNLALLYNAHTFCGQYDTYDDLRLEEYSGNVAVVENPTAPTIISNGKFIDTNPPLTVNREWTIRIDAPEKLAKPSAAESALTKTIFANQDSFRSVGYSIIPYDQWATSEASRKYFARLDRVTASSDEQFPYAKERTYPEQPWPPKPVPLPQLKYDGEKFVAYNWKDDGTGHCYEVKDATLPWKEVNVSYKGAAFTVARRREVFLPESKSILMFTVNQCQLTPGGGLPIPPPK